jgi:hypothetical protein
MQFKFEKSLEIQTIIEKSSNETSKNPNHCPYRNSHENCKKKKKDNLYEPIDPVAELVAPAEHVGPPSSLWR